MKTKKLKRIKAWAFLATGEDGYYFVTNLPDEAEIYLKKPEPINHPFTRRQKWKPVQVNIEVPLYENQKAK